MIGVSVDGQRPFVTISQGSGHLGSGGALWLEQVLDGSRGLQPTWNEAFTAADAMWLVPYLTRLQSGERLTAHELLAASDDQHGHAPGGNAECRDAGGHRGTR